MSGGEFCACQRVVSAPIQHDDGSKSACWECDSCKAQFAPAKAHRPDNEQVGGDHYVKMKITPWQVIDTWPKEQRIGAYRAFLLKHTMRLGSKDELDDEAGKAAHVARKLRATLDEP